MNILITRNDFCTLMDIVIVNPTHIDIEQRASMTTSHATMMDAQEKTQAYTK
jgi:hypothetical protein